MSRAISKPRPRAARIEPPEILQGSQLRQDFLVPALRGPDGPGAADIAGLRRERIVDALAVHPADGLNRRKVEHIEAHFCHVGEPRLDVLEITVTGRFRRGGAGEQLVPAGECGALAIDRDLDGCAGGEPHVRVAADEGRLRRIQRERLEGRRVGRCGRLVLRPIAQERGPFGEMYGIASAGASRGVERECGADLQCHPHVGEVLAPLQLLPPRFEVIHPGRHVTAIAARHGRGEFGDPDIVALGGHVGLVDR